MKIEIAKSATIEDNVEIGDGTKIAEGAYISSGTKIGENCFIGYNTVIRPDVTIGDNTEIRALCFIAEKAVIGNNCKVIQLSNVCKACVLEDDVFFGANVITCDTKKISHRRGYKPNGQPPYFCRGVRVGSGVVVNPGVRLEMCSMIQTGSVVTRDTDPYGIYRGVPARKIGDIQDDEKI